MKLIFVIDDDPVYLETMMAKLRHLGFEAEGFENVLDALPRLRFRPEVIFLDHNYVHSVSKGYEFIELIRLHTRDSIIVYSSSDPMKEALKGMVAHPADAFLQKNEQLFEILEEFMSKLLLFRKKKNSWWNKLKGRFGPEKKTSILSLDNLLDI